MRNPYNQTQDQDKQMKLTLSHHHNMGFLRNKLATPKINKNHHFKSITMRINQPKKTNHLTFTDTVSNNNNKTDKTS